MITAIDKHTALVLIDLQKGIVSMDVVHPVKEILEQAALLLDAFRKANKPVVIVHVKPAGAWLSARKDFVRPSGTPMEGFTEIVEEIETQPDDIFVTKHTWSAFHDTALHEELQQRGITGIVLAGISTGIGVEGTARTASALGYNISFATDAMTDTSLDAHVHSIRNIFPRLGEVGMVSDVIQKLGEGA